MRGGGGKVQEAHNLSLEDLIIELSSWRGQERL